MLEASTKTISRQNDIKGRDRKTNKKRVQIHEEGEVPGDRLAGGKDGNALAFKLSPSVSLSLPTGMSEVTWSVSLLLFSSPMVTLEM